MASSGKQANPLAGKPTQVPGAWTPDYPNPVTGATSGTEGAVMPEPPSGSGVQTSPPAAPADPFAGAIAGGQPVTGASQLWTRNPGFQAGVGKMEDAVAGELAGLPTLHSQHLAAGQAMFGQHAPEIAAGVTAIATRIRNGLASIGIEPRSGPPGPPTPMPVTPPSGTPPTGSFPPIFRRRRGVGHGGPPTT